MLIGLIGRRGTGKDTIANHLVTTYAFRSRKFSAPLKDALKALFGLTDAHMEGPLKEVAHPVWGVSPRCIMQYFGTDIMQGRLQDFMPHVGRDHAIIRMRMDGGMEVGDPSRVDTVVSDVRFQHEVDALLERGALLVRVRRAGHLWRDGLIDLHESEVGVDSLFSHVEILNDAGFGRLLERVDRVVLESRETQKAQCQ